jgi:hypothetical protein
MTVTIGSEAQQWVKTRDNRTGRQLAVAVPSQSTPGKFHLVTLTTCDCKGFSYRGDCRHVRAVQVEATKRTRSRCSGCLGSSVYHRVRCGARVVA